MKYSLSEIAKRESFVASQPNTAVREQLRIRTGDTGFWRFASFNAPKRTIKP